jgi:hypothetical protein
MLCYLLLPLVLLISLIKISSFKAVTSLVTKVTVVKIDIDRHRKACAFFYVVLRLANYNLILRLP